MDIKALLEELAAGRSSVDDVLQRLKDERIHDLGFARLDLHRAGRTGVPEVIFCSGKTSQQIIQITEAFKVSGHNVLASRMTPEQWEAVQAEFPEAAYHEDARLMALEVTEWPAQTGRIAVICAGTSDLPVAEEAAYTAEYMGVDVERLHDVGVAGLHRLVEHLDLLDGCRAVVVVAGMEGALPSVVAGLIDKPVIAVPTSVGYGTHLNGMAALLGMLNSCSPGISVVNIDNGFGAAVAAVQICRVAE